MSESEKNKSLHSLSEIKKICTVAALCMLFALIIFFAGFFISGRINSSTPVITGSTISQQIKQISNLTTTEYEYTNVGKFENNSTFQGFNIPFTKKSFLLTYSGKLTAGISLENLQVNIQDKKITIILPNSSILSNEIDENSIEVYDETKNIFNQISISDYTQFAVKEKAIMHDKAIEKGILTKADEKAKETISYILKLNPEISENYTIEFRNQKTKQSD